VQRERLEGGAHKRDGTQPEQEDGEEDHERVGLSTRRRYDRAKEERWKLNLGALREREVHQCTTLTSVVKKRRKESDSIPCESPLKFIQRTEHARFWHHAALK